MILYYQRIDLPVSNLNLHEIVFDHSKIEIQYLTQDKKGNEIEPFFTLSANNNKHFTLIELLFGIHNQVCYHLENTDTIFFEGLACADITIESDKIPLYFILLGT